jgi:hypothetical protein
MVTGLLKPDRGSIAVFGIDALADPVAAKRIMAPPPPAHLLSRSFYGGGGASALLVPVPIMESHFNLLRSPGAVARVALRRIGIMQDPGGLDIVRSHIHITRVIIVLRA